MYILFDFFYQIKRMVKVLWNMLYLSIGFERNQQYFIQMCMFRSRVQQHDRIAPFFGQIKLAYNRSNFPSSFNLECKKTNF